MLCLTFIWPTRDCLRVTISSAQARHRPLSQLHSGPTPLWDSSPVTYLSLLPVFQPGQLLSPHTPPKYSCGDCPLTTNALTFSSGFLPCLDLQLVQKCADFMQPGRGNTAVTSPSGYWWSQGLGCLQCWAPDCHSLCKAL